MSKYGNKKTIVDNIVFDSAKEAARYSELKLLVKAGYIGGLVLQPKFPLVVNGVKVCTYIADFSYTGKDGKVFIEDVKGVRTPMYSLKAKIFHALFPNLRITEL